MEIIDISYGQLKDFLESKETKGIIEQIPGRVYVMISGVYSECIPEAFLGKIAVRRKEELLKLFFKNF